MIVAPLGTVLVVEDEAIVRELIVHVLQRAGYWVLAATDGNDALNTLRDQPVDLILTDLRMPSMDGIELLQEVRKQHPSVDTIVLTAYGSIDSAVQALKLGAIDYLAKPFDINELLARVEQYYQQRQERDTLSLASTKPLIELYRILSRDTDLPTTLDEILALVKDAFAADDVCVHLFDEWEQPGWSAQRCAGPEAQEALSASAIRALAEAPNPWRLSEADHPHNGAERPYGHIITVPIAGGAEVLGALQILRQPEAAPYTEANAQQLHTFGAQIGLAMLHAETQRRLHRSFSERQEMSLSAAEALAEALGTFDEHTRSHSRRVASYARCLANALELSEHACDVIEISGLLHDIGKLGVGEATLHKAGPLTDAERDRVKLHPVQGARILSGLDTLAEIVPLVRHHHERYDGQGYPDGLAGEQIPFGARLLAVVDAYDSMTTDRPYRRTLTASEACERLLQDKGAQFDPALVEAWLRIIKKESQSHDPLSQQDAREIAHR